MSIQQESVQQIIDAIGGVENINTASHCVTRLRLSLKDEAKVDIDKLESIDLVKGSFSANGQFQVIIGQGTVNKVYDMMIDMTGLDRASKGDVKEESTKKLNPFQKFVKILGDIFIPILPAIVTAGLLLGLNNILVGEGIFFEGKTLIEVYPQWKGFSEIVNVIASTAFAFLPGLVGWSAVKTFGGTPLLGIVMGLMLIHPSLDPANQVLQQDVMPAWDLFGLDIPQIGYQGQVLPVLLAGYILANIEKFLRKRVHDSIQLLVVAPTALLVTGFLVFTVIGPISLTIGTGITDGILAMFDNVAPVAGFIYGGINALLVVTGMHHTFIALDLQMIAAVGMTYLWPVRVMSNIAQGSATLAMMFATKDKKLKGTALAASISAYLGVTEPAMFGVNIRFKFPFIAAMIGAAFGGMIVAMNQVEATIGIGGLPGFLNVFPQFWGVFFLAMGIAIVVPFALTLGYAKYKDGKENAKNNESAKSENSAA